MRGDRGRVVVAADDCSRTYEIVAMRAGRGVGVSTGRGIIDPADLEDGEKAALGLYAEALEERHVGEREPVPLPG
jgi:hypothetical protein